MRRYITKSKLFFHKNVNKSKTYSFLKKIIPNSIDWKVIIHKCTKLQANIFKNKKTNIFVDDDDNYNRISTPI